MNFSFYNFSDELDVEWSGLLPLTLLAPEIVDAVVAGSYMTY